MIDRKYPRLILLLIIILLVVAGYRCWQGNNLEKKDSHSRASITVTDTSGRQVQIPASAQRIACLSPFSAYAAVMLGQGEKITAIPEEMKRDVLLLDLYPNLCSAPTVVAESSIKIDELLETKPDIVFVNPNTLDESELKKLEDNKITYLNISYADTRQQQDATSLIGRILGAGEKSQAYNNYYRKCLEKVSEVAGSIDERERVPIYHAVNEATSTDKAQSLSADWTFLAGAKNISVNQSLRSSAGESFASLEQIVKWNPDIILVNEPETVKYIKTKPQLSSLGAVKEQQVYQMPVGISRWGHPEGIETPLAALWTAKILYPDRFQDVDIKAEAKAFYQTFFNYQASETMLDKILNAEGMLKEGRQPG